jgi:hypothetical protein
MNYWFDDDRFILTPNRRKHIYLKQKINDWRRWGQIKYVVARNSIGCEPKHSKSELVDDGMEWTSSDLKLCGKISKRGADRVCVGLGPPLLCGSSSSAPPPPSSSSSSLSRGLHAAAILLSWFNDRRSGKKIDVYFVLQMMPEDRRRDREEEERKWLIIAEKLT